MGTGLSQEVCEQQLSGRLSGRVSCRERDWERCPWESGLTQTLPCSAVGLSWRTYGGAGPGLVVALYKGLCAWVPRVLCASGGHREAGWPDLWLHVLCSCGTATEVPMAGHLGWVWAGCWLRTVGAPTPQWPLQAGGDISSFMDFCPGNNTPIFLVCL